MEPVEFLWSMMDIDSTGGAESALADWLAPRLEALGFEIRMSPVDGGRVNLLALPPGGTTCLLCTHLDTVPPHLPARRDSSRIYGRGACDAKGQIAAMAAIATEFLPGPGPGLLLVSGEETDHAGAKACADLPEVPIVIGEPTCNRMASAGKGMLKLRVTSSGVAAHSAFPERGKSAVDPLVESLHRLLETALPDDPVLGPTTLNIGTIEAGVADNVIPPRAEARIFIRCSVPTDEILRSIQPSLEGLDVEVVAASEPIHFDSLDDFETAPIAFGTDGPYLPTRNGLYLIGAGDIEVAHSDDEFIDIDELRRGIDLLRRLVSRIGTR